MTPAQRLVSRYKAAGFIPDKFWKTQAAGLKTRLETPLDEPHDVTWGINDVLKPYFGLFQAELLRFGLNRHATDSVKFRVEMLFDGQLSKIADSFANLSREIQSAPYPRASAVDEVQLSIEVHLKTVFNESLPTLGKALKTVWRIVPGSTRALAEKLVRKATPEELQALERSIEDDYSTPVLNVKYGFFKRVNLEGQAKKLITKDKVERDYLKWFEGLKDMLLANYGEQGLDSSEGFDDFSVGNLKVILVAPEIGTHAARAYASKFVEAQRALQQKGFGKLWYGAVFVTSSDFYEMSTLEKERYKELGYETLQSQAGTYHSGADVVKLTAPSDTRLVRTIVHEMGHRYWFRFMKPDQRARFNGLVQTNPSTKTRDFPSGPTEDGVEKRVTPVSDYGKSSIEEAFAEAFQRYVLGEDMTRLQMETLRSVMAVSLAARYKLALELSPADIERWKKDLRVMTKVYKSVGLDGDERDQATWAEAEKLFLVFRKNFEQWAYKIVLPKVAKGQEPYLYKDVQKQVWDALHTIRENLFPTLWGGEGQKRVPDFAELRQDRDKNITRYNKAFNLALKTVTDFITDQKDRNRHEDESYNIGGMNVLVQGYGRSGNDEDLDAVLSSLRDCVAPIIRAGFKSAVSGMRVVVDFDPKASEQLTAAQYSPGEDRMKVYPLGMAGRGFSGFEGTFVHESGHRYWFKEMTSQGRAHWDEVLTKNSTKIEAQDVRDFVKLVEPKTDQVDMLRVIDRQPVDDLQKAKYRELTRINNYDLSSKAEYESRLERLMVGEPVLLEDISEYAASGGPVEAFAEVFKAYALKGPGAVKPMTLDLFKRVVSSGGVKLGKALLRR